MTAALAGAAFLVTRGVRRLPRDFFPARASLWLRHGLAALARPGAGAGSAIVALGLGVLVVLGMSLVERRLASQLSAELPTDAPSVFLVDVQPDQWPGVERILRQGGARGIESVPVVMARVSAIDGVRAEDLVQPQPVGERRAGGDREDRDRRRESRGGDGRRWALTREQRLTYMKDLPKDNEIVEGALWSDPRQAEVSVEQEFADDIGVKLGSTLRFDVQGVPLELVVTSLRTVDWQTFGINFFLVVEPGVLEQAPQQRLAVARLPKGGEQRVQDQLAANYPNVTLLRIREILEKILKVLGRIGLGIRFLGGFTVVGGSRHPGRGDQRGLGPARARGGAAQDARHDPPGGRGHVRRGVRPDRPGRGGDRHPRRHGARLGGGHPRLRDPLEIRSPGADGRPGRQRRPDRGRRPRRQLPGSGTAADRGSPG